MRLAWGVIALFLACLGAAPARAQCSSGNLSACPSTYFNTLSLNTLTAGALAGSFTLPAATSTYTATGSGAVATTVDATIRSRSLSEWQFATAAQQADARSLTASIDQTAAFQHWIAACIAQRVDCYLPPGKYLVNSAQILVDFATIPSNGIRIYGDNTATTIIDFGGTPASHAGTAANPGTPPFMFEVSGGTTGTPAGETYGSITGISFVGTYAGAMLQFGKPDFSDALNQGQYQISIQNYNTTSASTCAAFNYVLSSTMYMNCSSAAGPSGGNYLWVFNQVAFSTVNMGGSNGQYFLHITNGSTYGDDFINTDCEIVTSCVVIDAAGASSDSWYGGRWAYTANGVIESAGGNNAAFYPNTQLSAATTFVSSGSAPYFSLWQTGTISPTASPVWSGTPTILNASANSMLDITSGSGTSAVTETTGGNMLIDNLVSNATLSLIQAGASGAINFQVGSAVPITIYDNGVFVVQPLTISNPSGTAELSFVSGTVGTNFTQAAGGNFLIANTTSGETTTIQQAGSAGTVNFIVGTATPLALSQTVGTWAVPMAVVGGSSSVELFGGNTGASPTISAYGMTNTNLNITTTGTGVIVMNGNAGATCLANTVSLTTMTVSGGIVTHC